MTTQSTINACGFLISMIVLGLLVALGMMKLGEICFDVEQAVLKAIERGAAQAAREKAEAER